MNKAPIMSFEVVPVPTGRHCVGTIKYDLEDTYRKDFIFPNGRLIPVQIYFPMQMGVHETFPKIFENRAPGPFEPLKVKVHSRKADLSLLEGSNLPIVFLNHGSAVAMTDYSFLAEDLSSNGYLVISIQHDLKSDHEGPKFWEGRSCSRNAKLIDNLLFVFEWLKEKQKTLFNGKIDLKRIGFIGHSLGANSLLFWSNRTLDSFYRDTRTALLSRPDQTDVKECLILMESTRFSFQLNCSYPLFFLLSGDRGNYHKETGCDDHIALAGHKVKYYKGATHISFMDHGYINPEVKLKLPEPYFDGTLGERKSFFDEVRKDIREFLEEHIGRGSL